MLVLATYLPLELFAVNDEVEATDTVGAGAVGAAVFAAFLTKSAIDAMVIPLYCFV